MEKGTDCYELNVLKRYRDGIWSMPRAVMSLWKSIDIAPTRNVWKKKRIKSRLSVV
ncbi:MAG: hypothetical protein ACLTI1_10490 [Clostridia bacterium]